MAAAASLLALAPLANPNPNRSPSPNLRLRPPISLPRSPFSSPRCSQFNALKARRLYLGLGFLAFDRRIGRNSLIAASFDESPNPDIEVEKEKDELKPEANEAEEAWQKALESFKEEAIKMKAVSEEAYKVFSKKAIVMLKETSETLKIQAEKARQDLNVIAKQISEEGKVYLSRAAEESPEPIKDVVETFASSTNELKEISAVRDFHLGIPYGAFLTIGGFLWFMLTGSTSAIRFGVVLGSALLALSVASLRSWKSGQSSEWLLKGQAAIATIIFLREWRLFCQTQFFPTGLMTLTSGAMVAFYVYRIMISGGGGGGSSSNKGPASENSSEN